MTKSEIVGLAERCEKATGPDQRLDVQIEIALHPEKPWIVGEKPGCWPRDPIYGTLADFWTWATDESKAPPEIGAPRYTASLDAAMTLVPEGYGRMVSDHVNGGAVAELRPGGYTIGGEDTFDTVAHAKTWPLALCAAALRARATLKEHEND